MNQPHPSGPAHWTRQPGVHREPWTKIGEDRLEALYQEFTRNRPCKTWLARKYGISRTTVWRYIKRQTLGTQKANVKQGEV